MLSGLYLLMSLGFALITGVTKVFNLAHGSLYMLCAYFIYSLSFLGLGASILLSLIFTIITGIIIYQFFIHPLREKKIGAAVVTLSLAIFFQALVNLIWGPKYKFIPSIITSYTNIFGVRVANQKLLSLIVAIILVIFLELFINRTRIGKSIRAVAQNTELAKLVGINTRNTFMVSMGISALLAGFAAVLFAPLHTVSASIWTILFRSFPVLILGGLGSLKGALVGAFIIAFTEKIIEFTVQESYLGQTITFGVMLLIIFIKPEGIFGKKIYK